MIGSITLISAFVAFPAASALLQNGAGVIQIATFVSCLMMAGAVTVPLEIKYFGKRIAIVRNVAALLFSFVAAVFVDWAVNLGTLLCAGMPGVSAPQRCLLFSSSPLPPSSTDSF